MKIATLQYQYDFHSDFESYKEKISQLVADLAKQKVELLLFPEYAGLEMVSFVPSKSLHEWIPAYLELFQGLSQKYQMLICAGTQIVPTGAGTFNRSYFFSPNQKISYQDKCNLTPYEIDEGILSSGNIIRLFETNYGKIVICICYDIEFPLLVKKVVDGGAKLILVPSYTSTVHGYYRVFMSCRARALENQCFVVHSSIIGRTDVEIAYGSSAICSPIDDGFPEDGLLAVGLRNRPLVITAELDFQKLEKVRSFGETRNYQDNKLLEQRVIHIESLDWTYTER